MGLLPDTLKYGLSMHREYRKRFPHHSEWAIPACITARVWPLSDKNVLSDSGHVRVVMHAEVIADQRFPFKSVAGNTFPTFPAHANPHFYVSGKRPMEAHYINGFMQRDVTPMLKHCRYVSFTLSHRYEPVMAKCPFLVDSPIKTIGAMLLPEHK